MTLTKELKQLIEHSMAKTTNAYAVKNEMYAATAIQDAYLCLMKELEDYETKTKGAEGT
jgi:hypothetical protein